MHAQLGGHPRVDPELAGEITHLIWPGNASENLRKRWKVLLVRRTSEGLTPDKQMIMIMDGRISQF